MVRKTSAGVTAPIISPIYARFFSSGVLRELAHKGRSAVAARLAQRYGLFDQFGREMAVREFYDAIFKHLIRDYRHEYIYKNAIAEKILLGTHSLNTSSMLMEFRADDCIADAVILNGTSHVYEIKSEMDSFERLDRQIAAYKKIFDFITIITSERLYEAVEERISPEVGIMVLADRGYQFRRNKCHRIAKSNKRNVDPAVIFDSLRKQEYLRIIKDELGVTLANCPNTRIYSEAKKHFELLSSEVAHDAMVKTLKTHRKALWLDDFIGEVPGSLKAALLSMRLTKDEGKRFINLLSKDIASVFV